MSDDRLELSVNFNRLGEGEDRGESAAHTVTETFSMEYNANSDYHNVPKTREHRKVDEVSLDANTGIVVLLILKILKS